MAIERTMQESDVTQLMASAMLRAGRGASSHGTKGLSELSLADRLRLGSTDQDPRGGLTLAQRRVLWRLARGQSITTAAALEHVHPERVRRWLATPRFERALLYERAKPSLPEELLARH